jgi:hypothetical protein
MRIALSILLLLHGIAHLPGFLVSWRLMKAETVPYGTTIVGGALDVGDGGIRFVGVLWLLVAAACVVAGVAGLRGTTGWPTLALSAVTFSFLLCIIGWPAARLGLALDAALLAVLSFGVWHGWFIRTAA